MDFQHSSTSVINDTSYRDPTRSERHSACQALEAEYSGEGPTIDRTNINTRIQAYVNQTKLNRYATYINFYKRVIDIENPTYVTPPTRYFMTSKGKKLNKDVLARIEELYGDQHLNINLLMLEMDRRSMRVGTVAWAPQTYPDTNRLYSIILSPDNPTFDVTPDDRIRNDPKYLWYESIIDKQKVKHFWTPTQYMAKYVDKLTGEKIAQEDHGFDGVPFAILRSVYNTTKFWGPFDASAWKLAGTRSLLLADTIHRTQVSDFEYLLLQGYETNEAIEIMKLRTAGKVIPAPFKKGEDGKLVKRDAKFVSPTGIEPKILWETYINFYRHFMSTRDINPRINEHGKQVASGDAMIQSDVYMRLKRGARKTYLASYERQVLNLIRWQNNQNTNNVQIPDDITVELDWQPDKIEFVDLKDKNKYLEGALIRHELTSPKIIRMESGEDISIETAIKIHQDNRKYNLKYGANIQDTNIQDEPIDEEKET